MSTSVVAAEQPVFSPPMMPASDSTPSSSAMTQIDIVERIALAVEGEQRLAGARPPHHEIAAHLRGIEHMQRPAAVVGDEVGDIDEGIDRAQSDRRQPLLQPVGRRTVLDAAHEPQREGGTERRRGAEIERHPHRTGKRALYRLDARVLELPHVGGGEIARDAVHAGAVGTVRRQVDLDHGIAEAGPLRVVRPDRRIVRQVDDAFVVVGKLQLEFGDEHAAALDAADGADGERHVLAGDKRARRHEHALHAGARIGRAAHHLDRIAAAGIHHADAQPVGIGVLFGLDHPRDDERRQELRLVLDALDLEPDHGELVDDLAQRAIGVEMLLEPAEGEFHHGRSTPPCRE